LRDADIRKDEFLATLAHELRNPLTSLTLGFDVIEKDQGRGHQTLPAMERQLKKLLRLVDDLLDVSRIGRGKVKLRLETIDVVATVQRAIDSVQPQIRERQHQLSVTLPSQPLYMDADPVRVEQIIVNLLSNAAKFTDPGGTISIELVAIGALDGGTRKDLMISVKDSGMGIEPAILPRIFDIFAQASTAYSREQIGLGVGLYLVRQLVELHGGSIVARSAGVRRGSEFVIRLPLRSEAVRDAERRADDSEDIKPPSQQVRPVKSVLIIDDNRDAADTVASLYRMEGHEARVAYDGVSGLEAAHQFTPNLIVLDIAMPGMSGHEVATALRSKPEFDDVVICAISGYEDADDHESATPSVFDTHLVKPPSWPALEALLDRKPSPSQARSFRALQENSRPS
jgi:CheY-like chemotaxis protein